MTYKAQDIRQAVVSLLEIKTLTGPSRGSPSRRHFRTARNYHAYIFVCAAVLRGVALGCNITHRLPPAIAGSPKVTAGGDYPETIPTLTSWSCTSAGSFSSSYGSSINVCLPSAAADALMLPSRARATKWLAYRLTTAQACLKHRALCSQWKSARRRRKAHTSEA
jgi:hypothetical protein